MPCRMQKKAQQIKVSPTQPIIANSSGLKQPQFDKDPAMPHMAIRSAKPKKLG